MTQLYKLHDVVRIVGVTRSTVRLVIKNGFVVPERGPRKSYLFTFRDLIVFRMAKGLSDARLSPRRISTSLGRLRRKLPLELPLSGLRIAAVGRDVVVVEPSSQWRADDGQLLLAFDVTSETGELTFATPAPLEDWFSRAFNIEESSPEEAIAGYRNAIEDNPCASGAYANLGRLLHETGRLEEAEAVYLQGQESCPGDATLLFNFALLREDQKQWDVAVQLYLKAIAEDPGMGDAHFNLGLLYQTLMKDREAVRHLSAYRKLLSITSPKVK
ncbi:MAG: tetratricopeptide repeat protein [Opitutaceae bacterium]|nr:tetratricopeptide repeat protein [Verrucomicrobiales bacterium]